MSTIEDIRRNNGWELIKTHGQTFIAHKLGHKSPSRLSQVFGPSPTRAPSDKMMRKIEEVLGLPALSTDKPLKAVADVIRLVGDIAETEAATLGGKKFADLVALAYTDSTEHGGKPREAYIRSVVRLLK